MNRLFVIPLLGVLLAIPVFAKVKSVKIQNLSTMNADVFPSRMTHKDTYTQGEWGFAALIEIETESGKKKQILFDTGAYPETVIGNIKKLEVDFRPSDVVLSHFHADHTGGLSALKKEFPQFLNRVHVGKNIYSSRREIDEKGNLKKEEINSFIAEGRKYFKVARQMNADAGIEVYDRSTVLREIDEDVMLVYRPSSKTFQDFNTQGNPYRYLGEDGKYHEDDLPEEVSLVINTKNGLIIVSGCAHRGVLNTADSALADTSEVTHGSYSRNIFALVGGFHLLFSDKKKFSVGGVEMNYNQTIAKMLTQWGVKAFWGAHCTGHQATESVLQAMKNNPKAKLSDGFDPKDPVKIVEGRAGQTFIYDGTGLPQLTQATYR